MESLDRNSSLATSDIMEVHRSGILETFRDMDQLRVKRPRLQEQTDLPPPINDEEEPQGPVLICVQWSIYEQALYSPPPGWTGVFRKCHDALRLISHNLQAFPCWYPSKMDVFAAFRLTPLKSVRVVILGQDPYPGGEGVGLAFSVKAGTPIPSSLSNIFQEVKNCYPEFRYSSGDLTKWALQGVLLLNKYLTVSPNQPESHERVGWMSFISEVIKAIVEERPNTIFLLWGNKAKSITSLLPEKIKRLETSHPSGRSARMGFLGCGHFRTVNQILTVKHRQYLEGLCCYWVSLRPSLQDKLQIWKHYIENMEFSKLRDSALKVERDSGIEKESQILESLQEWTEVANIEMVNWSLD